MAKMVAHDQGVTM